MLKRLTLLFVAAFAVCVGLKAGAAEVASTYTVIDLGATTPGNSGAMAQNGWSTFAGYNADGTAQPFLVSPTGVVTRYGTSALRPNGISNSREVVGADVVTNRGFRYTSKTGVKPVGVGGSGVKATASCISTNGMFIGGYAGTNTGLLPWRYLNIGAKPATQSFSDMGATLFGVNNLGEFCGTSGNRAYVQDEYGFTVIATGPYATANAISNKGTVVGNMGEYTTAFMWSRLGDGTANMRTVKSLYNGRLQLNAVNDNGSAVGNDSGHACIVEPTCDKVTDLGEIVRNSGWRLYDAKGISQDGKILAFGASSATAPVHALLLIPGS
jgi:hypothetical protein